jgi:hypothetical protein
VALITADAAALTGGQARVHKNGSVVINTSSAVAAFDTLQAIGFSSFVAGDYVELYSYHASGANRTLYGDAGVVNLTLSLAEIPQW